MYAAQTTWLLARSSGMLAYLLLTAGVVAGLVLSTRMFGRAIPPAVITAVHRTLSILGLGALAVHVGMLVIDTKVDIPLISLVIPGLSEYRPIATGVGVIALELWLLVQVSFPLRRWIGTRAWRRMHIATFVLWGLAAAHGITAGSDSGTAWAMGIYVVTIGVVAGLIGWRVIAARYPAPRAPRSIHQAPTHTASTPRQSITQSPGVTHV